MVTEINPKRVCSHFQKARKKKKTRVPPTLRRLTALRRSVLLPLLSTHSRVNQGFIGPKDSCVLLTNPESPLGFDRGETSEDSKASNAVRSMRWREYGAVLARAWLLDGTECTVLEAWLWRKGENPRVLPVLKFLGYLG
ncbi:hypothetical protein ERO13_A10G040650v2 [Gossypium hirsutum]|uniref:Uncharacterized protein n=1 Tax=Gossypium hirsutum TaxID=3635 RepID=A0A1U8MEM1_GOSHI|nr:uncharacterized protein LOC107935881 [Gossypium hirsutum]KAG4178399.1 hypothetical protein ERO13_A10G040650v2 [Gossypium hirsutum]